MLEREIKCPACMHYGRPGLPKANPAIRRRNEHRDVPLRPDEYGVVPLSLDGYEDASVHPEDQGQSRLDELVGATEREAAARRQRYKHAFRPPPMDGWYILTDSGPRGPYSNEQIVQFAQAGRINAANRLRNARTGEEARAGDVPGLLGTPPGTRPHSPLSAGKPAPGGKDGWYVQTPKGNAGPFTNEQIVAFARAGKITAKTMLRYGKTGRFVAADTVHGLVPTTS